MARALNSRGWMVHIIVSHAKGDLFDRDAGEYVCHDLSQGASIIGKILEISNFLNDLLPTILLLNHCAIGQYALPLLASTIKPVAIIHSDDPRYYSTARHFSHRVFRWVAPTLKVAQWSRHFMSHVGDRICLIPHGIDDAIFYPGNKDSSKGILISFAGYLDRNKGVDLLIPIFEAVTARFPDAVYAVIGEGPLREKLEHAANAGMIRNKCIFTGAISPVEVADIFRKSSIFILPTRIEGFGLAIAEAMMCGAVPVVTWLKDVTDQLVDNGSSGFLIEQDDVAGFVGAISMLLADDNLLHSMSETAADKGVRSFSLVRMIKEYERMFSEKDDRLNRKQRNRLGWLSELLPEMLRTSSYSDLLKKGKHLFH